MALFLQFPNSIIAQCCVNYALLKGRFSLDLSGFLNQKEREAIGSPVVYFHALSMLAVCTYIII